ncbi:MAG: hypothetical protein DRN04_02330 [Thermoprotei archaeon]|nr:MAG: hypothetical protein DRN04_02330 [Thermoprotei archaeon]
MEAYEDFHKLVSDLRDGRIFGSTEAAEKALLFIKNQISSCETVKEIKNTLISYVPPLIKARPTSALTVNCLREVIELTIDCIKKKLSSNEIKEKICNKIDQMLKEAHESVEVIAEIGAKRIRDGDTILTNTYSYTVLKVLEKAKEEGKNISVFIPESRPGGEGIDMAVELYKRKFPVTLFVDSAVRYMMKEVDLVLIGAEAIAANGAVVNKIGTSMIALAAHEARVRVFVAAGTYKFSLETFLGEVVELTYRRPEVLLSSHELRALGNVKVLCPAFDVTPPEYIDAIITERGVFAPQAVPLIVREIFGWPPLVKDIGMLINELKRC